MTTPTSIKPNIREAVGHWGRMSCQSRAAIAFRGKHRGHESPAAASRMPHFTQCVLSRCLLGMDDHLAFGAKVFQLVCQEVKLGGQRVRIPRDVDPRFLDDRPGETPSRSRPGCGTSRRDRSARG